MAKNEEKKVKIFYSNVCFHMLNTKPEFHSKMTINFYPVLGYTPNIMNWYTIFTVGKQCLNIKEIHWTDNELRHLIKERVWLPAYQVFSACKSTQTEKKKTIMKWFFWRFSDIILSFGYSWEPYTYRKVFDEFSWSDQIGHRMKLDQWST